MEKKLADLDEIDKEHFEAIIGFMNETHQNNMRQRLKLAQKYGLDLTDDAVLELVAPKSINQDLPATSPVSTPQPTLTPVATTTPSPIIESKTYEVAAAQLQQPQQPTPVYGENWIVLQNRLLNAITDLDLNERRLIMFLSPLVRKSVEQNPNQRTFVIKVQDFQTEYSIKGNAYYVQLAESCSALVNKSYAFWDFKKNQKQKTKTEVSWLTKAVYQDKLGEIHVDLHNDVVEMLTVFDKANPFTKYERQLIVNLGCYGMILFELISSCMHQQYKQKSYTIEYLREKFNCVDTYTKMADFKVYVLNRAIKDIEQYTPYRISYTQNKKGRVVSEIVFSFEDTSEKTLKNTRKEASEHEAKDEIHLLEQTYDMDKAPGWQSKGLSDAQIKKLAIYTKDFVDANTGKIAPNDRRDYPEIFEDWKQDLKDPATVNSFHKIQELLDRKKQ